VDLLLWYIGEYAKVLPAPVLMLLVVIFRDMKKHMKSSRDSAARNCVHHAAMFSKLGIDQSAVMEMESNAGLKPGKDSDY
jgi:hypothetical protein